MAVIGATASAGPIDEAEETTEYAVDNINELCLQLVRYIEVDRLDDAWTDIQNVTEALGSLPGGQPLLVPEDLLVAIASGDIQKALEPYCSHAHGGSQQCLRAFAMSEEDSTAIGHYVVCASGGGYMEERVPAECPEMNRTTDVCLYNHAYGRGEALDSAGDTTADLPSRAGDGIETCDFARVAGDWAGCTVDRGHVHAHTNTYQSHHFAVTATGDRHGSVTATVVYDWSPSADD